jgi:hypothetical protein
VNEASYIDIQGKCLSRKQTWHSTMRACTTNSEVLSKQIMENAKGQGKVCFASARKVKKQSRICGMVWSVPGR